MFEKIKSLIKKDDLSADLAQVENWLKTRRIKVNFIKAKTEQIPVTVRTTNNGRYEFSTVKNNKKTGGTR